ncbi:MAG: hypothetical protein NXI21_15680 [Alphaproteobacteria bacterium]|nr:hypothetical protein [Alphaproteobacteria bacterium]
MEGADPEALELGLRTGAQFVFLGLIFLLCIAGMGLHVMALRHRRPGVPIFGHKDSLFRRKHEIFTEEGMKYVEWQKRLVVLAMILVVLLFVLGLPDA